MRQIIYWVLEIEEACQKGSWRARRFPLSSRWMPKVIHYDQKPATSYWSRPRKQTSSMHRASLRNDISRSVEDTAPCLQTAWSKRHYCFSSKIRTRSIRTCQWHHLTTGWSTSLRWAREHEQPDAALCVFKRRRQSPGPKSLEKAILASLARSDDCWFSMRWTSYPPLSPFEFDPLSGTWSSLPFKSNDFLWHSGYVCRPSRVEWPCLLLSATLTDVSSLRRC